VCACVRVRACVRACVCLHGRLLVLWLILSLAVPAHLLCVCIIVKCILMSKYLQCFDAVGWAAGTASCL